MMQLSQAAQWMPGAHMCGDSNATVLRVHTDTRTTEPGDLFVALRGESFDANNFLEDAQRRGAVAAVCLPGMGAHLENFPRIEVPDTKLALGALATAWRRQFQLPLIAVTGSNGKTTVTQMLASILDAAASGDASLATRGNLNNDIGVPLTLLRLRSTHRWAVVELGMNHPGEIASLALMAQPTIALVNNAQREHLEFMGTVDAVAQENGAVIGALHAGGCAVFPADDAYTSYWSALATSCATRTFAIDPVSSNTHPPTVHCVNAEWGGTGWRVHARSQGLDLPYTLTIAGRHNIKNSLAAIACALAAGVPPDAVIRGLEAFRPVKGRSRALQLQQGLRSCTVIDDTYNANPDSVRAAIDVLSELPPPRLLVLGDMGEVGDQGPQFHAEVGRYAKERGIEQLKVLGALAMSASDAFAGATHFDTMDALVASVQMEIPHMASVLVKGSRFMRMERVVEALNAR
ncbi:MAG: UDP-N-acetylmuramoylalanyl-D-glutamyl-2, 6-diaminopimelate--D-alanyl-D-alanine ligase [Burkholderiales bacterium PBB4]|nr:MAG: UDP-N-acetylmuramoylalanyl-D-glutamyl-2, 6-diaminopimelate--D-alanyl-D-alanine ligase [Burkholderiales bacterium PBB4]